MYYLFNICSGGCAPALIEDERLQAKSIAVIACLLNLHHSPERFSKPTLLTLRISIDDSETGY